MTDQDEKAFVLVSDNLEHGKNSVYTFMDMLIEKLVSRCMTITDLHIFSDGAASQFKSKFIMSILHVYEARYGIKIHWHFFATSHGKGVIDGIGGTVKAAVWRRARAGRLIQTPKDFAHTAAEVCPSIEVAYVSSDEIQSYCTEELESHWEIIKPVKNTQRMHSVKTFGHNKVLVSTESASDKWTEATLYKDDY